VLSDFYREASGHIHVDAVAAVRDSEGKAIAAVCFALLRQDLPLSAHTELAYASRSAETILVERRERSGSSQ